MLCPKQVYNEKCINKFNSVLLFRKGEKGESKKERGDG